MKILFIIRAPEHLTRYNSIIKSFAKRGHGVTVLFDKNLAKSDDIARIEIFKKETDNFNYNWLVNREDNWKSLLFSVRSLLTYRRFLVIKNQSNFFRERWKRYLPFWLRIPVSIPGAAFLLKTNFASSLLRKIEAKVPPDNNIVKQLKKFQPNVVVSPMGGIRVLSPNTEYVTAAKTLGIPSASPVISWDSLTTKSLITVFPDIFLLWNDFHKKQIMEHHGVPDKYIRIIGASVFDKWFTQLKLSAGYKDFARQYGLNPKYPYVLYLGSARGTAEDDTWLVKKLRAYLDVVSDPKLSNLQIMVRPHPANAHIYKNFSLPGVVVAPKGGALPDTPESLKLSYKSYRYAAAVTGIFTSAMMEALIVGKPVIVFILEKYQETQGDAEHFRNFVQSAAVQIADGIESFIPIIKKILAGEADLKNQSREKFIRRYIRPCGLNNSAGDNAVLEIEKLAQSYNKQ